MAHHVLGRRLTPEQMENSSFETLQKGALTTKGSGEEPTVNDSSTVVCGGVRAADVTVHVVAPS